MRKRINMWKYFGLNKEDVLKYKDVVSLDDLKVLSAQCLAMGISLFIVGPVILLLTTDNFKGYFITGCGAYFASLFAVVRNTLKSTDKISATRADFLIFMFSFALFLMCLYIGVFDMDGFPAVTLVAILLFIQIDFDTLPKINLAKSLIALAIFLICSYITKMRYIFIYDVIDSVLCTSLGLFVSWQKAKIKWENVITHGKLSEINNELNYSCMTDELTKLSNRRHIFEEMEKQRERCIANNTQLTCIIMDIDHFKEYNDTYGHPQGDILLQKLGELLLQLSQNLNINIGRIGGEEFMFFWEETNPLRACSIAEQIRLTIQNMQHPSRDDGKPITVSMGICTKYPSKDFYVDDSYREADNAMYRAKLNGKNSCWRYSEDNGAYAPLNLTNN